MAILDRRRSLRRSARIAVSACRPAAPYGAASLHGSAWFHFFGPSWQGLRRTSRGLSVAPFFSPISAASSGTSAIATGFATRCRATATCRLFAPTLLLLGYSLVLGLYFGFFGLGVMLVRRATGSTRLALAAAPVLWAGIELAASRITCVPWDQLGYSQVDNALVNQLAPWTGVYGISFVLVAVNALIAGGCWCWISRSGRLPSGIAGAILLMLGGVGLQSHHPSQRPQQPLCWFSPISTWLPTTSGAVPASGTGILPSSPNLPTSNAKPTSPEFRRPLRRQSFRDCVCPPNATHPDLVAWPESPAPFEERRSPL